MPARKLTPLETAFAHNNGIDILTDQDLIERMERGDAHNIADTWFQEFANVHKRLYSSRGFNHDDERPGIIWHSRARVVAPVLTTLVKQLYDEQGYAKKPSREQLATYLADAYTGISNVEPFEYGGALSLRVFFTLIGKTRALTDDKGHRLDIDFTRLNKQDLETLELPPEKNREKIDKVFEKLLDPANNRPTKSLPAHKRWGTLPKSETEIVQKHFLSHTLGHTKCLVTINGGLVPLDAVEGDIIQHINRSGHPADFTVPRDKIVDYLIRDGRENASSIDGIDITDKAVPLVPLNVDLLTGLDVTTQLPSVKKYCQEHNTHLLRLPEYVKTHDIPDILRNRLERAADHIEKTRPVVWSAVDESFKGIKPVPYAKNLNKQTSPKAFITMGGTGSGKSNLEEIVNKHTDGSYVTASLDEARTHFKMYDLYAAVGRNLNGEPKPGSIPVRTGHHLGDYKALETGAGLIREGIVERAKGYQGNYGTLLLPEKNLKRRYNLLYDGSGVPYKGKYEQIVRKLSEEGFDNTILVADAPIEKAYERAEKRLRSPDGRAVPPKVIVDKHRGVPHAMRDAARDEYVRHFEVIDTTRDVKGEHYTLVQRFTLKADDVKELERARKKKEPLALYKELRKQKLLPEAEDLRHAPDGWEDRVEFVVVSHNHHAKQSDVLIITDRDRMTAISRKGALNPDASGLEDLHTLHQPFEILPEEEIRDEESIVPESQASHVKKSRGRKAVAAR
jgi:hypothetical protein